MAPDHYEANQIKNPLKDALYRVGLDKWACTTVYLNHQSTH